MGEFYCKRGQRREKWNQNRGHKAESRRPPRNPRNFMFRKQTKAIATISALFDVNWIKHSLLYFPIIPQTYTMKEELTTKRTV